jgi:hypothetical protein
MGIFMEQGRLYAKFKPEKLMGAAANNLFAKMH